MADGRRGRRGCQGRAGRGRVRRSLHAPHRTQPGSQERARAGSPPRRLRDEGPAQPATRTGLHDRAGSVPARVRCAQRDQRLHRRRRPARYHRSAGAAGSDPIAPRTQKLVVVGADAWNGLIRANSQLLSGGDIFGEVELAPGGSAANTAVWAQRCGQPTRFVGKVGHDRFGVLAREELEAEGVEADWLITDAHLTGSVAVWIDHQGQRSMVSGKGADHYLLPSELPTEVLTGADHLHLHGWSFFGDPPRAAVRRAAAVAREAGATLSFDPGSFQMIQEMGLDAFIALTADLGVDLLFPNAEEGQVLTGETDPERVAARLAELYPGAMIALKLDANGSYLLES